MVLAVPLLAALASATDDITFAHWNPHWQCFSGHPTCAGNVTAALTTLLQSGVDFVNVVELEAATYEPPAGWASIAKFDSCGRDWDTLFFNTARWRPASRQASGCVVESRSFAAGAFQNLSNPELVLTVVGAHFPQTLNASTHAYANATANLRSVFSALDQKRNVLLADTNTESPEAAAANSSHHGVNKTNAQLLADLGLWPAGSAQPPPAAPLFRGCCASDNFSWQGDRIVADFGTVVSSKVLFDPAPSWATFSGSEFHKGVLLTLRP